MKPALFASLCLLLCACASQPGGAVGESNFANSPISFRGTTSLRLGRLLVAVPASAMPSGQTGCLLLAEEQGTSGAYGNELDDTIWDVNIFCDQEDIRELFNAIKVCIAPEDGNVDGKQILQRHGENFMPLPNIQDNAGYVCGEALGLSLFTLGLLD